MVFKVSYMPLVSPMKCFLDSLVKRYVLYKRLSREKN